MGKLCIILCNRRQDPCLHTALLLLIVIFFSGLFPLVVVSLYVSHYDGTLFVEGKPTARGGLLIFGVIWAMAVVSALLKVTAEGRKHYYDVLPAGFFTHKEHQEIQRRLARRNVPLEEMNSSDDSSAGDELDAQPPIQQANIFQEAHQNPIILNPTTLEANTPSDVASGSTLVDIEN